MTRLLLVLLAAGCGKMTHSANEAARAAIKPKNSAPPPSENTAQLTVRITPEGFSFSGLGEPRLLPRKGDSYDLEGLAKAFAAVKAANPKLNGLALEPAPGVPYSTIIQVMDTAIAAKLPDIELGEAKIPSP